MHFGKYQSAFEFNIELLVRSLEKYSRGRRGAPAKGIGRLRGARVQIPPSPLCFLKKYFFQKNKKDIDKRLEL